MQHICSDKLLEKVSDQFIRTLRSDKFYVDSSWKPYLFFMNSLWFLCGSHLKSLRFLCGFLIESLWLLLPCHYVRLKDWAPHQHDVTKHMQSIWHGMWKPYQFLCESSMISVWISFEITAISLWIPVGITMIASAMPLCKTERLGTTHTHMMWPSICKAYGMAWQSLASSKIHKCQKNAPFLWQNFLLSGMVN